MTDGPAAAAPSRDAGARRAPSKLPGAIQTLASLSFALVVAMLALNVSQAPPPAIAEFSPQAVERPETAAEQAGRFGTGGGDLGGSPGGGQAATTTTSTTVPGQTDPDAEKVQSRLKRCVDGRQIEDPQSPPCVDYFDGDNGGATSRGVTEDEIRVAVVPQGSISKDLMEGLKNFFNTRFQFYGRKITLQWLDGGGFASPDQERGTAKLANEQRVFAALGTNIVSAVTYYRELAQLKIIAAPFVPAFTDAELVSMRPYVWTYKLAPNREFQYLGDWACSRLLGPGRDQKARHGSGPTGSAGNERDIPSSPRKVAIYFTGGKLHRAEPGPLRAALARCGVNVEKELVFSRTSDADYALNPGHPVNQQDVREMRARGVTTVLCICGYPNLVGLMGAATSMNFAPEWVGSSYGGEECNSCVRTFLPVDQRQNLMGLSFISKPVPTADQPYCAALVQQGKPCEETLAESAYHMLLLLSSGFQMAGPNLTPESFEKALRTTIFPNPEHYTVPAKVGFADGYTMLNGTGTEFYWQEGASGPRGWNYDDQGGPGAHCYVNEGRRYAPAAWPPAPDQFFAPGAPCDTGVNPKRPPS